MVTMKQEESMLKLEFGNEKQQNVNILTPKNPKKSLHFSINIPKIIF
jgi:hypothetical protein